MTLLTRALASLLVRGPVLEGHVLPDLDRREELKDAALPPPAPVPAILLIDTGAAVSVLSTQVLRQVGARRLRGIEVLTPTSTAPTSVEGFLVDIELPNSEVLQDVFVIEAALAGQEIQGILGRNVLQHGLLIYHGYLNQFTLGF